MSPALDWLFQALRSGDYTSGRRLLEAQAAAGDALCQALVAASAGEAAARTAADRGLARIGDPDLRTLGLALALERLRRSKPSFRQEWADDLALRIRLAVPDLVRPEARLLPLLAGVWQAEIVGNQPLLHERLIDALERLPPTNDRRNLAAHAWLRQALVGRLSELPPALAPTAMDPDDLRARWDGCRFIDAVTAGRLDLAERLLPRLAEVEPLWPDQVPTLRWYQGLFYVIAAIHAGQAPEAQVMATVERILSFQGERNERLVQDARELVLLAAGRAEELRPLLGHPGRVLASSTLMTAMPIRVALCLNQRQRAAELLDLRARNGHDSWVDTLFRSRVARLEDDADEAARLFVGSSRVDLQACKLEYSIVSPK